MHVNSVGNIEIRMYVCRVWYDESVGELTRERLRSVGGQ